MTDLLLVILVVAPVIMSYSLKSDAALSFLALCSGFVLLSLTSSNLQQLLDKTDVVRLDTNILGLILLLTPPLVTLAVTRGSARADAQRYVNLVPALCLGGFLALIAVPLLNTSVQADFGASNLWSNLQKIQPWVIGAGVLASLMLIWADKIKR